MKARLKESHDYITLSIPLVGRSGLNLTINRYGTKISAPANAIKNKLFEAIFDNFDTALKAGNYGEQMKKLHALAESATSVEDFSAKLTQFAHS